MYVYYYSGLLRAVVLRYRYCSGATFTVAVAPLLLVEKNGDGSAATISLVFGTSRYQYDTIRFPHIKMR